MKIAMISPNMKKEKAISYLAQNLVNSIKKTNIIIENLTFTAGSPKSFFNLIKKFKNYDIVHIQHEYNLLGWFGIPFLFIFLYFIFPKKYIVVTTMHTTPPRNIFFKGGKLKNIFRKVFYNLQNKVIDFGSDYIVVHQNFSIKILEEYGFKKDKMCVLRQGIIDNLKIPSRSKSRKELNLSGPVYLIIGNLAWDNGADIILKQADKIGKTVLVATNPKSVNLRNPSRLNNWISYLQEIVKGKNFFRYVRFDLREIPYSLWWKYFAASDIILLPYRGSIGSGIFTDSMATKTPVVASNITFFRQISGRYGCVLISKNDKEFNKTIKKAMNPKNYNKMKRECERYLKENSWTEIGKKYKSFYKKIIQTS